MNSPENIQIETLATDIHASQFLIFIRESVRNHRHASHSETVYILSGSGSFRLGDKNFAVSAGDFIQIPQGQVHGVVVTSTDPLKVLSVQTPEFHGVDRLFVDP